MSTDAWADHLEAENERLVDEAERKWANAESDKLKADADLAVLQARLADVESRLNLADAEVTMLRHFNAEAEFDLKNAAQALRIAVGRQTKAEARLDWIEANLIEGKWDGTIGRPKSWVMVGPYRHTLQKMCGDSLREAIDAAMEQSHE